MSLATIKDQSSRHAHQYPMLADWREESPIRRDALDGPKLARKVESLVSDAIQKQMDGTYQTLSPIEVRVQNAIHGLAQQVRGCDADLDSLSLYRTHRINAESPGMASEMAFPKGENTFQNEYVESTRLAHQGNLHNPRSAARTTGNYYVVDDGRGVESDKPVIQAEAFLRMLDRALHPRTGIAELPYTSNQGDKFNGFVTFQCHPQSAPAVAGYSAQQRTEVLGMVPAGGVFELAFGEGVFGNAGSLTDNDLKLSSSFNGKTNFILVTPEIKGMTLKELGLPYTSEDEKIANGGEFKIEYTSPAGVKITLISDNYPGYFKKTVKANLNDGADDAGTLEHHSGDARIFQAHNLGPVFNAEDSHLSHKGRTRTIADVAVLMGTGVTMQAEGYAIDSTWTQVKYVPENAVFDLHAKSVSWAAGEQTHSIPFEVGSTYFLPSGQRICIGKVTEDSEFTILGASAEALHYHKIGVSGAGKSELAKHMTIDTEVLTVQDLPRALARVEELINRDYSRRYRDYPEGTSEKRAIMDSSRELGSVVKLFTPSSEFTDDYNSFIQSLIRHEPQVIEILLFLKSVWNEDMENGRWKDHLSTRLVDGQPSTELLFGTGENKHKVTVRTARLGKGPDGRELNVRLRPDFAHSEIIQTGDDIQVGVVAPARLVASNQNLRTDGSVQIIANVEDDLARGNGMWFQRPDDGIEPGADKLTERYFAGEYGNIDVIVNYQRLDLDQLREIRNSPEYASYAPELQAAIRDWVTNGKEGDYFVLPSHPRIVGQKENGDPIFTKNPRYGQTPSTALHGGHSKYLADTSERLYRGVEGEADVMTPINFYAPGQRLNPQEGSLEPLACFGPMHYLPPEVALVLFMSNPTGKSPSTTDPTRVGREGVGTKGPFAGNPPIYNLESAAVEWALCDYDPFVTAAGYLGKNYNIGHNFSFLWREAVARLKPEERSFEAMLEKGWLEQADHWFLGYRMSRKGAEQILGTICSNPSQVFNDDQLFPRRQGEADFQNAVSAYLNAAHEAAKEIVRGDEYKRAMTPVRELVEYVASDDFLSSSNDGSRFLEIRSQLTKDAILSSPEYDKRLESKREADLKQIDDQIKYMEAELERRGLGSLTAERTVDLVDGSTHTYKGIEAGVLTGVERKHRQLVHDYREMLSRRTFCESPLYLEDLRGTIGRFAGLMDS